MTLLDEPPVATMPPTAGEPIKRSVVPAWRFASRLARREVRRRPGRTVLAALLIAVPVAAMTTGSILARTNANDWAADFQRDYGDTDIVLNGFGFGSTDADPATLTPLPDGSATSQYLWSGTAITSTTAYENNKVWYVQFGNMPFSDTDATAGIRVVEGRAPQDGEVLLGPDTAQRLGVDVGDQLTLARPSGTWLVAGLGEVRGNYWSDPMIIPGFDTARFAPDYGLPITLIDLPEGTSIDTIRQLAAERGGVTRYDNPWYDPTSLQTGMRWGFVGGVLALVAVGIIVAAAFATSARRQLVTIGQLSANGATESVVRRTLALQGTWTGVVGAIVGVGIGLAALPWTRSIVAHHVVQHEIRGFRFSVSDLIIIFVTAVVAATVAAAVPARSAARVPVMAALAGRRPTGKPAKWLVPTGLALLAGGLGLVAIAALGAKGDTQGSDIWALLVVIGVTAMVFGTCCAAPLVVEKVGALGRRASISWRMALRSLARSRSRSAAVVAAIAVAVGGATAVAAIAEAGLSGDRYYPPPVPADAVVVWGVPNVPEVADTDGLVDYGPLPEVALPAEVTSGIRAIAPDAEISPSRIATFDPAPFDPENGDYNWPGGPQIATPAVLDLVGMSAADRATLAERGAMQMGAVEGYPDVSYGYVSDDPLSAVGDEMELTTDFRAEDGTITVPYVIASDPMQYSWQGQLLMTEEAAIAAGFTVVDTGVIVRTGTPLTATQLDELAVLRRTIQGTPIDAFIEPGDPPRTEASYQTGTLNEQYIEVQYEDFRWQSSNSNDLWIARLVIVGAALALSLLVVAIGLALAAAEGREERDTFTIVGARPSSMRRQAAARAAVLALVGIGLGIPLGFAPTWVVDQVVNEYTTSPIRVPWLVIGSLLVIIPMVAAGAAWSASGLANRFRPASPTRRD